MNVIRLARLAAVSIVFLGAVAQTRALAQTATTLSGKVTQGDNNRPMAGALVVIDELRREARTGDDGVYKFEGVPPGSYHVGVRAEGYSTRRTEVTVAAQPVTLNLAVDFDLHFAEVLSVSPNARPQFESYQPTSVLAGQELAKQLESTIGATLSEAPGVATRAFGPGPARPVIRGLDGDRIAVLEDGQRMGDLSSQSGDHAVPSNPAAAKKIEVVRGPATLLYGANAIGGLVNVITDQIPTEKQQGASGTITLDYTSNGSQAGGAGDIHVGNGKFAAHFGGAGRHAGNYTTPEGDVDNSGSRMGMGTLGAAWTGERSYVGASYGYDGTKYGIPVVEDGQISLTPKRNSFSARAGGSQLGGWLQSYRATVGVRRYEHSELTGTEVGTTFNNNTVEGEVLLSHRPAEKLTGSFGVWFLNRHFKATGEEALSPPVEQQSFAGFVYEEFGFPHATVQFGGRLDHAAYRPAQGLKARDFNEFSGSVGLLLRPLAGNDNFVLAINVARAARYPALEELYYLGPHPGNLAFEVGNDELNAEHAIGFDVSVRGRSKRFEGELTFFRNDIKNYIFRQPTGEEEDGFPVVENIGADSVLFGAEAHADLKVTDELTVEVTYDWVKGELSASGQALPRIPPFRVLTGLTYRKNAFQFGGSVSIVSDQTRVYGTEVPTDGYTTGRVFGSYSFNKGGMLNTITARLDNATDALYRNHLNYLKDVLPEIGRTLKLVYTIGF